MFGKDIKQQNRSRVVRQGVFSLPATRGHLSRLSAQRNRGTWINALAHQVQR